MRSRILYVSPDVQDALWTLGHVNTKGESRISIVTPDEIADTVLRKYINDNYPHLFEQLTAKQKEVDEIEKKLIQQLKPTTQP